MDTSVDSLIEEFEQGLKPAVDNYSRRLVEFCCSKAIKNICPRVGERISDGSISRFTYDMMLAWQNPSTTGSERSSVWISFLANSIVLHPERSLCFTSLAGYTISGSLFLSNNRRTLIWLNIFPFPYSRRDLQRKRKIKGYLLREMWGRLTMISPYFIQISCLSL